MSTEYEQQARQMREQGRRAVEQVETMPTSVYLGGVIASIALSAILFMMGRRDLGLFVGLWPPTILNLALFSKQLRPSREIEEDQGAFAI
jgi:hypothetical protein